MRAVSWTRGATCALAISIAVPVATAERPRRSLASCTVFDQVDSGDDRVALTIGNQCTVPVRCELSWRVICAPDSKNRRASHRGKASLSLASSSTGSAEASAAICGDDSWQIDSVRWSCQPDD